MKPGFALSLSFEGITLLSRGETGWHPVGEVRLDVPDLAGEIADLRQQAEAPGDGDPTCKIILPNDQIRFLTVDTGNGDTKARRAVAARALDGATPYRVEELAFDISAAGAQTHVAAVALETLAEAEDFAVEHGFAPVSFVAVPEAGTYVGEPFFGQTRHADRVLVPGDRVEPDAEAIVVTDRPAAVTEPADSAEAPVAAEAAQDTGSGDKSVAAPTATAASSTAQGDPSLENVMEKAGAASLDAPAGFSSRRRRSDADDTPRRSGASEIAPIPVHQQTPPRQARPAPTVAAPRVQSDFTPTGPLTGVASVSPVAATRDPKPTPRASAGAAQARTRVPEPPEDAPRGGFISRRRTPVSPAASGPAQPVAADAGMDDSDRMTVFGARTPAPAPRAKPRYLGLILTVILLVVLAGVAAFAAIFTDTSLTSLFSRDPQPERAATLDLPEGTDDTPAANLDTAAIDPRILEMPAEVVNAQPRDEDTPGANPVWMMTDGPEMAAPDAGEDASPRLGSAPDNALTAQRDSTALGSSDALSGTDAAVLDALRAPSGEDAPSSGDPDPDPEELADAPLPEDLSDPVTGTTTTGRPTDDAAAYAATGIWSSAPEHPETPGVITLDDLFIAAIDGATLTQDALALPTTASYATDISPNGVASPAAAGTAFKLDALGLVDPTPEGTVNPDGILVYLGTPPSVPPPTPTRIEDIAPEEPLEPVLPAKRPRGRPGDLVENAERARLGGLTLAELGGVRPRERPYEPDLPAEDPEDPAEDLSPLSEVDQRLAALTPKARPGDFASTVAEAQAPDPAPQQQATASAGPAAAASTASSAGTLRPSSSASLAQPSSTNRNAPPVPRNQTAKPTGPTPTTVAKQATIKNAINLRQVNLIGVYGTPSNRRALVRLSSGRYKKVKVGDRIDGGQIVAIGDTELRYQKSGRNVVLRMPKG
ncbi:MAG: hypothetical protein CML68_08355 [Rhodobacteraceae bacterium]|nr:hypothetical protein [Paracoccaceae bacterium]